MDSAALQPEGYVVKRDDTWKFLANAFDIEKVFGVGYGAAGAHGCHRCRTERHCHCLPFNSGFRGKVLAAGGSTSRSACRRCSKAHCDLQDPPVALQALVFAHVVIAELLRTFCATCSKGSARPPWDCF
ncbi:hypothetical protein D9M72_515890 [compost metagenome]